MAYSQHRTVSVTFMGIAVVNRAFLPFHSSMMHNLLSPGKVEIPASLSEGRDQLSWAFLLLLSPQDAVGSG